MSDGRRFHPSELDLEPGPESAELLATARDLESYAATGLAAPSVSFEDRVMAAVADEPMPSQAGRGFFATVRDAWAIAFGPDRPVALRAQAFAMLFALALAVGSIGSVAVVGASRLLGDQRPTPPTVPSPLPSPSPSSSVVSPSPSPAVSPSPSPSPSESETAEPSGSDDNGGRDGGGGGSGSENSGSGSGSSGSGSGSSGSGSGTDDSSGSRSGPG